MEVKKIVEGMTAPEVAQVIDENFNGLNAEKATVEAVADIQKNVGLSDDNTGILSYPVFDDSESVEVGAVRRYEGLLYRSKVAGANYWDPEKWERVTLKQLEDEKLSELASKLIVFSEGSEAFKDNTSIDGEYDNFCASVVKRDARGLSNIVLVTATYSANTYFKAYDVNGLEITEHTKKGINRVNTPVDIKITEDMYFYSVSGVPQANNNSKNGFAITEYAKDLTILEDIQSSIKEEIGRAKAVELELGTRLNSLGGSENVLLNPSAVTKIDSVLSKGILRNDGVIADVDGYSVSDFVELPLGTILLKTPKFGNSNYCYCLGYNESKEIVFALNCTSRSIIYHDYNILSLPYNVKYVRYSTMDSFDNECYGLFYGQDIFSLPVSAYESLISSLKSGFFNLEYLKGVTTNMNNGNYIVQDGWISAVSFILGGSVCKITGAKGFSIRYSLYNTTSKRYDRENFNASVFVKGDFSTNNNIEVDLKGLEKDKIYTIVISQQTEESSFEIIGGLNKELKDLKSGKDVLWIGTSIPEGGSGVGNSYPQQCAKKLGFNVYNNARGSSYIHSSKDGVPVSGSVYNALGLVDTLVEKEEQLAKASGLTDFEYNRVRTSSYEYLVMPYINGEIASCTTIVFDHGYNDSSLCKEIYDNGIENIDWNSRDKNTFIGAFNFLYDEIMKVNPNIRIVIAGFLENEGYWQSRENGHIGNRYTKAVCAVQEAISKHYGFPILKMWEKTNFTFNYHIPNSSKYLDSYGKNYTNMFPDANNNVCMFQYFCPDAVHPHSSQNTSNEKEAKGLDWLSNLYASELRDLIH